ncbi:MAG TPA: BACON domain-containing carbohydrate-binding protein [Pyrinomonadaceae bacterium]|jgi:hypothetical protein
MKKLFLPLLICALALIALSPLSSAKNPQHGARLAGYPVARPTPSPRDLARGYKAAIPKDQNAQQSPPTEATDANSAEPGKQVSSATLPKKPTLALRVAEEEEEEEGDEPLSDIDPQTLRDLKRNSALLLRQDGADSVSTTNHTTTEDSAAAKTNPSNPSLNSAPVPSAPNSFQSFAGVDDSDQLDGFLHTPPDADIAVGPTHIVTVVNSMFAIYSKTGTLVSTNSLQSWFNNVCAGCSIFDPRITYDTGASRWVMMALYRDSVSQSKILISVSQTSNPTGSWWNYSLDSVLNYSNENTWADYPDVGFDGIPAASGGAIYITVNQFTFTTRSFRTAVLYILPKSSLYNGTSLNYWRAWDRKNSDNSQAFTFRASKTYGNPGGEFLINTRNNGSTVSVWRVNPTYPPAAVDWTLQTTVNIGSYSIAPNATQPGTTDAMDTIDNRIYNAVWQNNRLYAAFTEAHNWGSGTVAAFRYLKINTSSNTAEINETFGADGLHYYSPAIATDSSDNIVLVFSRSGPSEYAGARYTGRLTTDSTAQGSAQLKAGTATIFKRSDADQNRWGDYQGAAIDPSDGNKVWIYGQWAVDLSAASNDYDWGTWIGQVQFSGVAPSPANDNFASAQVISGSSGSVAGSNINATKETGEPNHAGLTGGASIWYQWQAPSSGNVTMTTTGSSFDTVLGVYTGSSVNALTLIASNDDDPTSTGVTSRVTFNAVAGTIYRIAVDGYGGSTGSVTLNWTLTAACSYSISPPSRSFTSGSGTGSITVTAGAGCTWTASSNAAWIVITSGSSGTGNGTVSYSVSANTGASSRSGAITVSGQNFTGTHNVSQNPPSVLTVASLNPASGVSISVSPSDINVLGSGTTQFTRTYHNNTSVSLTAPSTVNGNTFQKWQRDGADWTTALSTSLTMDTSHTMTAVYIPKVQVTIQTNPSGRTFTVDGVTYSAAVTLSWNAGSLHTISTTSPQSAGTGSQYVWSNWSDGGAISHSVSPTSNTTYTANFILTTQPSVATTAATSVASTSATLNGLINPNGSATNGWFEWGTSQTLATFSSTPLQAMGSGGSSVAINSVLSNLNPTTTYYYRVAASNSLGTSKGSILSFTTPLPSMNVIWTNAVGVSVSGNTLTKTASSIWGNAGASSSQSLTSGDGYMEFTATSNTDARLAGLSKGDTDQNWQDVDFGIDPANNGQVYIYEAGVARGVFGTYASGDRFRVAVEGGVVKYYRNGGLLYTSTVAPAYPLLVDSAIYSTGASVANTVIAGLSLQSTLPPTENVAWANIVGATASGNTLTKTASSIWGNSGGSSTRAISSGDGYMEFTATSNTDARLAGLSKGDTDQNWQDVDFGIDPANNGQVYIYEAGIARGVFGTYASGDRFRVAVVGGVVKYYRNGGLLYTSTVAPAYPLLVDSALYSTGVTVSDAVIGGSSLQNVSTNPPSVQNVAWANIVGATASGNTLTKTASSIWGNAGASSSQSLTSGDGFMEFTASSNTDARLAGLSKGDTDQNWQDVDFGIDPANNGQVYIYEAGVARGVFGTYASGDRFRVAVEGGVVKYYKNGGLLYTSTVAPTYPLLVDSAIYSTGASVANTVIAGSSLQIVATTENVSWANIIGASVSNNTLTKFAAVGWGNAGAISDRAISSGDGYMEFTASSNTDARLAGLSKGDTDQNWQDVDFGIDPANNGQVYIYEAGVARGVFGTYASGDRFRVAVEGGVVKYYRNGGLLYTSMVAPAYPLLVDSAIYSTGGTISNAVISGFLQSGTANALPLDKADGQYMWAARTAIPLNGFRSADLYAEIAGYYERKLGRKQSAADVMPLTFYITKGTYRH